MAQLVYLDDDRIQHLLMKKLIKIYLPGCSVEVFSEPEALDAWLADHQPDLILSDLNFETSSGWDWVESFAAKSSSPIVFVTASCSPEDRRKAANFAEVKAVIEKPISEENWKMLEALIG